VDATVGRFAMPRLAAGILLEKTYVERFINFSSVFAARRAK
jgi:hypothetical protein